MSRWATFHSCPCAGLIDRAVNSVQEKLQVLVGPKTAADPKLMKGVFMTTISFLPEGGWGAGQGWTGCRGP